MPPLLITSAAMAPPCYRVYHLSITVTTIWCLPRIMRWYEYTITWPSAAFYSYGFDNTRLTICAFHVKYIFTICNNVRRYEPLRHDGAGPTAGVVVGKIRWDTPSAYAHQRYVENNTEYICEFSPPRRVAPRWVITRRLNDRCRYNAS